EQPIQPLVGGNQEPVLRIEADHMPQRPRGWQRTRLRSVAGDDARCRLEASIGPDREEGEISSAVIRDRQIAAGSIERQMARPGALRRLDADLRELCGD